MVGNQLDDEPNIYIVNGSSTKNPLKKLLLRVPGGYDTFLGIASILFTSPFFTETRGTLSFGSSNRVPEKYSLAKWFILDLKMGNAMRKLMG